MTRIIQKAISKGAIKVVAGGNGKGSEKNQLYGNNSVATDSSGNIYVLEEVNNIISKWIPGSSEKIIVAGNGTAGSASNQLDFFDDGMSLYNTFYINSSGNLFIADYNNDRIMKWESGANEGVKVAEVTKPKKFKVDSSENIYVLNSPILSNSQLE